MIRFCFGIVCLVTVYASSGPAASPSPRLSVSGERLLLDGKPGRLIGYSDAGMLAETRFDYQAFFDRLEGHHVNLIRVWMCYHWSNDLAPFEGQRGRYDLLNLNKKLFGRLHKLVQSAGQHGIVVQVCLFDGCQLDEGDLGLRWEESPYNGHNNDQGVLKSSSEFDDVGSDFWRQVHLPLIDRTCEVLGDEPNVIFEIMNEPDQHGRDRDQLAFQQAVASRLRSQLQNRTGSRVISVNVTNRSMEQWALDSPDVDLVSFHLAGSNLPEPRWFALSKPVMVSNDGHDTVSTAHPKRWPSGSSPEDRANQTRALLAETFKDQAPLGHMHFEFMDKDLNGDSWRTEDYAPDASKVDERILDVLSEFGG